MPDPFDSFQLPSELRELLSEEEQQALRDKILEIHILLKKRDPELEDNRSRGYHLWPVFDASLFDCNISQTSKKVSSQMPSQSSSSRFEAICRGIHTTMVTSGRIFWLRVLRSGKMRRS